MGLKGDLSPENVSRNRVRNLRETAIAGTIKQSEGKGQSINRLVNYRLKQLEEKMDKHNDFIERLTIVEVRLDDIQSK